MFLDYRISVIDGRSYAINKKYGKKIMKIERTTHKKEKKHDKRKERRHAESKNELTKNAKLKNGC